MIPWRNWDKFICVNDNKNGLQSLKKMLQDELVNLRKIEQIEITQQEDFGYLDAINREMVQFVRE